MNRVGQRMSTLTFGPGRHCFHVGFCFSAPESFLNLFCFIGLLRGYGRIHLPECLAERINRELLGQVDSARQLCRAGALACWSPQLTL